MASNDEEGHLILQPRSQVIGHFALFIMTPKVILYLQLLQKITGTTEYFNKI
jgi:hypothetical protein